jgi:hypothetical protein
LCSGADDDDENGGDDEAAVDDEVPIEKKGMEWMWCALVGWLDHK